MTSSSSSTDLRDVRYSYVAGGRESFPGDDVTKKQKESRSFSQKEEEIVCWLAVAGHVESFAGRLLNAVDLTSKCTLSHRKIVDAQDLRDLQEQK